MCKRMYIKGEWNDVLNASLIVQSARTHFSIWCWRDAFSHVHWTLLRSQVEAKTFVTRHFDWARSATSRGHPNHINTYRTFGQCAKDRRRCLVQCSESQWQGQEASKNTIKQLHLDTDCITMRSKEGREKGDTSQGDTQVNISILE